MVVSLLLGLLERPAGAADTVMPHRLGRTNAAAVLHPGPRTNPVTTAAKPGSVITKGHTNATAVAKASGTNATSGFGRKIQEARNHPAFYPVVIGLALCLAALLLVRSVRVKKPGAAPSASLATRSTAKAYGGKAGGYQLANVLEVGPQARQVWQFDARGGRFTLSRQHTSLNGEALPLKLVARDWRDLFQRRLNIAWVPADQVFLRVAQFPRSDFNETVAMVELQLEKLSPMPVAQIAWSLQTLPHTEGDLQTVIVTIVARSAIEEFLGKLESQGFLADRLELGLLDQLQTTAITEDGAWIYPQAGNAASPAIVAWWYGGVLQNLDFLTLPPAGPNRPAVLKEQLMQMAWAGELEGWLKSPPNWHLVADVAREEWEPALRAGLEQKIEVEAPLPVGNLAALTARRVARSEPRVNLLPVEFAERYRQQFVDRLWMRGLLGVGVMYLAGVLIYMIGLGYATWRTTGVETQAAALADTYTNVVRLKTRYELLKDRQELKYAALDCWDATAKKLPENVTLDNLIFSEGRVLKLRGTAPSDAVQQLFNFERELHQEARNGQTLFDPNKGETLQWRVQGATATWTLGLELKRSEAE